MTATTLGTPPWGLELARTGSPDPALVAAADHASRHWVSETTDRLRPGTEAHKRAVGQMFRDTFTPYKPTLIGPKLGPDERDRLVNLPIWDIAVQTEGKARIRMHNKRSRVETAIGRYKQVIGDGLRFRKDEHRNTEVAVAAHVLNLMLELGRPISIRIA
jgi:hypothetical protein